MKSKDVNLLIEELNSKINHYVYEHDLFAGGCCFSAYALAKNLQRLGIKYRVVIFQYKEILNERVFTNAINGSGVSHVGIEVTYKRRKVVIGDCSRIYDYFFFTDEKYRVRKYSGITPEEILDGYKHNEWNWCYDRTNNGPLMRDINRIVDRFMEEHIK